MLYSRNSLLRILAATSTTALVSMMCTLVLVPVAGWDAKVNMRPLNPPVTVSAREIDDAVASIVWTGGAVGPKEFEQFLVTAGRAPTVSFIPHDGPGRAGPAVDIVAEPAYAATDDAATDEQTDLIPWVLLVGGLLVAGIAGLLGYKKTGAHFGWQAHGCGQVRDLPHVAMGEYRR